MDIDHFEEIFTSQIKAVYVNTSSSFFQLVTLSVEQIKTLKLAKEYQFAIIEKMIMVF